MITPVERVVCFGGSTMAGFGTEAGQKGYADQLGDHFMFELNGEAMKQRRPRPDFHNLAIWAQTAANLAPRVVQEAQPRIVEDATSKNLFLVNIGVSDAIPNRDTGEPLTPEESFTDSVASIATALAGLGRILYIGTPAIDEERAEKFVGNTGKGWNDHLRAYEELSAAIFANAGASCIRLFDASQEPDSEWELIDDGLHPTPDGHNWLRNEVQDTMDEIVTAQI